MKHHQYNPGFPFVKPPVEFGKHTPRSLLQYCLGATMYMPGGKDFVRAIVDRRYPGLTSMVMCFEDACREEDVPAAEVNSIHMLDVLADGVAAGTVDASAIPLVFFRVRSPEQFRHFVSLLKPEHAQFITGFNFPKFNSRNAREYLDFLVEVNGRFSETLYGMPIIEDRSVAFKETRIDELAALKDVMDEYRDFILNVRVGGTDFSSCFGVRRGIDYTIYDIVTVRDCLMDILNFFTRDNAYTVSGPVWEYFRVNKRMKFSDLPKADIHDTLLKRVPVVNDAVDGLMRELVLDQANGFVGKTCIHPSHINYINGMLAVIEDECRDAEQILGAGDGVVKGTRGMNEVRPHTNWAEKIMRRAEAYGVIRGPSDYFTLFGGAG